MHTLLVLSAVLCSLPAVAMPEPRGAAAPGVFSPSQLELKLFPAQPASFEQAGPLRGVRYPQQGSIDGRVGRILLQGLAGAGLGIGGTALGSLLAADYEPPLSVILPMSLLWMGSGAGVAIVGEVLDGHGSLGAAVVGSAIGFAVPLIIGTGIVAANGCSSPSVKSCPGLKPLAISLLVLPTIGAIIGYEISTPRPANPSRRTPGSHQPSRLIPTLAPAQQGLGATLGLAGTL